jgi:hypothetical protein
MSSVPDRASVYLVVDADPDEARGRLFTATTNQVAAHEMARAIGGVVAEVPIVADYRPRIVVRETRR